MKKQTIYGLLFGLLTVAFLTCSIGYAGDHIKKPKPVEFEMVFVMPAVSNFDFTAPMIVLPYQVKNISRSSKSVKAYAGVTVNDCLKIPIRQPGNPEQLNT